MINREIDQASLALFDDPRRAAAVRIAAMISYHSAAVMSGYHDWFEPTHCVISGSTARGTHLPEGSDFDIGLLPLRPGPIGQYETPFLRFVTDVRKRLAEHPKVVQRLSDITTTGFDSVRQCLQDEPFIDDHEGDQLITAKFQAGGNSILEITVGISFWHRLGLSFYNPYWNRQVALLTARQRKTVISQLCLLKRLALEYKQKYQCKFPSSRTFEQLLIQQAIRGSGDPLLAAMDFVFHTPHEKVIKEILTLPVPYEFLDSHPTGRPTSGDNPIKWASVHRVAEAIVRSDPEWKSFLKRISAGGTARMTAALRVRRAAGRKAKVAVAAPPARPVVEAAVEAKPKTVKRPAKRVKPAPATMAAARKAAPRQAAVKAKLSPAKKATARTFAPKEATGR